MPTYGHFIPNGHFPIRYSLYGHFIPYGHFPLWTLFHMDSLPYGQFADSPMEHCIALWSQRSQTAEAAILCRFDKS